MTLVIGHTTPDAGQPPRASVVAATARVRALLVAGLVGGHSLGLLAIGLGAALAGRAGLFGAAVGFACVIIFFGIGQAIELVAGVMANVNGLVLTMTSYAVRVIGLGLGLKVITDAAGGSLHAGWLFAGVTATVVGWVGMVVVAAARQRVPVYDTEYVVPRSAGEGQ